MKYALTYREVIAILMQRHVMVDGKVRTDKTYPAGFMGMSNCQLVSLQFKRIPSRILERIIFASFLVTDETASNLIFHIISFFADVVSIPKTNENFRLLYDTKGRFRLHSIKDDEAKVILFIVFCLCFSPLFTHL